MNPITTNRPPPCRGLTGRIFGHKFRPRYDEKSTEAPVQVAAMAEVAKLAIVNAESTGDEIDDIMYRCDWNECCDSTYVGDICIRCGLTVKARPDVTL